MDPRRGRVPYEVGLDDPHAWRQFERAPPHVRDALRRKANRLEVDPQRGTRLAKGRVPDATLRRWKRRVGPITNVYKGNLPDGWRLIYTLTTRKSKRVVLILEVVDHTTYDRLLGYA